jgi:hypothetical protein
MAGILMAEHEHQVCPVFEEKKMKSLFLGATNGRPK